MRDVYPGYYRPTKAEMNDFWDSATVVPDANVLLNFHRLSSRSREPLFQLLESSAIDFGSPTGWEWSTTSNG